MNYSNFNLPKLFTIKAVTGTVNNKSADFEFLLFLSFYKAVKRATEMPL